MHAWARRYRWVLWILGAAVLMMAGAAGWLMIGLPRFVKQQVVAVLRERFASEVEIQALQVSVFPRIEAKAWGIVLRHQGRTDTPPLMTIEKLSVIASLAGILQRPRRVAEVRLDGLKMHIPPRANREPKARAEWARIMAVPVVIAEMTAADALLEILPADPRKSPREFTIHHVMLRPVGVGQAAWFHALLTNPKPVGEIDSIGQFGPWEAEEPSQTPVNAAFSFADADLGTIHGLSGILSSHGKYRGVLDHLEVEGETETPRFALRISGNAVPLETQYVAVVDGTNGNTYLKSVVARLRDSVIVSTGEVVKTPGVKGRHVQLEAVAREARVEDLLQLVLKGNRTPMSGSVNLQTKIDLPPGEQDIVERLLLNGRFGIAGAHFTNPEVQSKLDSLSRRGQGQPKNENIENVIANLRGRFVMRHAAAKFSELAFEVPGATVQLEGSYNLRSEELDFHGHLLLDAKLSHTVTGPKSVFLKFFDPFFKKPGGGTSLPIKITGNRSNPSFGLDLHRSRKEAGGF